MENYSLDVTKENIGECPDCNYYRKVEDFLEVCTVCGTAKTVGSIGSVDKQDYITKTNLDRSIRKKYFRRLYRKWFRSMQKGRSLDIGCSDALLVEKMEECGWSAVGIDSYEGLEEQPGRIIRADVMSYMPENRFSLITMIHSFEHFKYPREALNKLRNMLEPTGAILIVVPNYGGAWSRMMGKHWYMLNPAHHHYHYTLIGLKNVLEECGFRTLKVATNSSYAPSLLQIYLSENRVYERGITAIRPVRSLLFRIVNMIRNLANYILDKKLDGAEIQILVVPKA